MKKWLVHVAVLVSMVIAGCERKSEDAGGKGTPSTRPAKTKFVVAIPTYPGFTIPYLAAKKDFFEGIEVELKRIDDAGVINSGMVKGDIDACFTSVDAFVLAASQGVDAQAVLLSDESRGADGIVAKRQISAVADLRGKKVAANLGWPGHFFLLYNLKRSGIPLDTVPITNLDADKAGAAFISGSLDAAVTWEPWLSKATSNPDAHILVSTRTMPGVILDVLLVRSETVGSRGVAVQSFVNGYYKALALYLKDRASAEPVMAEAIGLPPQEFATMTAGFRFIPPDEAVQMLSNGGAVEQLFKTAADVWLEAKVIDKPVSADGRSSNGFISKYLKP